MIAASVRDRGFAELVGQLWLGQTAPLGWLFLQRGMLLAFGTSEIALRFVPLLFGLATLAATVWIGPRWMTAIGGAALTFLFANGWVAYHFPSSSNIRRTCLGTADSGPAAAAVEPINAPPQPRLRRVTAWWTLATIGQFFAVGAILVTPASALALLAIVWRRDGGRWALLAALPGAAWLAGFGIHYWLALRSAAESRYLHDYWAPFMPPGSAGVIDSLRWIMSRLGSLADKPGGADGHMLFWLAALAGVVIAWGQSRLALFVSLVPLSAAVWTLFRLVPLGDRVSLWMVPALYVGIALAIDGGVRVWSSGRRRTAASIVPAGVTGLVGVMALLEIANGRGVLMRGRQTANHGFDDWSAVQWLMAQRETGDALVSTRNGLPALGGTDGSRSACQGLIPMAAHIRALSGECAVDHRSIATMLSKQRRVLVYLGWMDDWPIGLDELLVLRLREIGTIVASRDFGGAADWSSNRHSGCRRAFPPPADAGPSLDASRLEGCLRLLQLVAGRNRRACLATSRSSSDGARCNRLSRGAHRLTFDCRAIIGRHREFLSRIAVLIAFLAALLAVAIVASGGFGLSLMGMRVSAHHPERAAGLAVASLVVAIAIAGRRRALDIASGYVTALTSVLQRLNRPIIAVMRVADRYWI